MTARDLTAPGFDPGAVGLPWWRRALRQGLGYFLPSSFFAFVPFFFADWPPVTVALAVGATALVLAFFLGTTIAVEWGQTVRWLWLAGMIGAILLTGMITGGDSRPAYFAPYVTAVSASLFEWRAARILIVAVSAAALGLGFLQRDTFGIVMAVMAFAIGWGVGSSMDAERIKDALRQAEERTAVLAVAAERERIGRDLHDILGHSLTTIAIKADLAQRLVGRSEELARDEIGALADIARQALADVRATASGMREVRLASEIASARSVLAAAGIEADTPVALPVLDDDASELFGFVVREAVTNVVRHAGAARCTITADAQRLAVTDDGRGLTAGANGSGLRGLSERLQTAGGRLEVTSSATGTTVVAELGVDR